MLVEVVLLTVLVLLLLRTWRKPPNYPPGLWGLPLIGYIPIWNKKSIEQILCKEQKNNGDIIIWRIGTRLMIFLFDFNAIKEAYGRQELADRPELDLFRALQDGRNAGIVSSNGPLWQNGRRFTLRHLRDLGMGKSYLVDAIHFEAVELVSELKKTPGTPKRIVPVFTVAIRNVIWQMVASKRYPFDDPQLKYIHDLQTKLLDHIGRLAIPDFFPWIRRILPAFLLSKIFKKDVFDQLNATYRTLMQELVDEHRKSLDFEHPKDYIDDYLVEMKNQEKNDASTMSDEDLIISINDLFVDGTFTVSSTLTFAVYYLANFPEVEKKLRSEIDQLLPKGTQVTFEDKSRLNYTEAFIYEVHRYCSLLNIGVMRCANTDTVIGGYTVPKGSIINSVASHIHFDPKYWDSPNDFRPERFLDSDGKFVSPKEGFLPFGIGKRQCMGESLARMELRIFLTTLVQSLSFSAVPGKTIDHSPISGNPFFHIPRDDQDVHISER